MGTYSTIDEGLAFGIWDAVWNDAYEKNRARRPGGGLEGSRRDREFRESMPSSDPGGKKLPAAAKRAAKDLEALYVAANGGSSLRKLQGVDGDRDAGSFGMRLAESALGRIARFHRLPKTIVIPAFKVWMEGKDLVWEGGDSVAKVARANPPDKLHVGDLVEHPTHGRGVVGRIQNDRVYVEMDNRKDDYHVPRSQLVLIESPPDNQHLNPRDPHDVPHTKTVAEVREILARLPKGQRCDDPSCPGWIVSESSERGLGVETCDDCMRKLPKAVRLTDDEVAQLPEAKRELEQTEAAQEREGYEEFEDNPAARHWGWDKAAFNPCGFQNVLDNLGITGTGTRREIGAGGLHGWYFAGNGVEIITAVNPIHSPYYAAYMGVRGKTPAKLAAAKKVIRRNLRSDNGNSRGLNFIDFGDDDNGQESRRRGRNRVNPSDDQFEDNPGKRFYTFFFESSWRNKPKQYWGPFTTREAARDAMDRDLEKYEGTKRSAYKIRHMSDDEFTEFWGIQPNA